MPDKSATPDARVADVATHQHGVVSSRQLLALGLSRDAVARRARTGRLHRIHQGVYAVGHVALAQEALWMAAILACGTDTSPGLPGTILDRWGAAISHRSAAELWQLLPPAGGPVAISLPGTEGRRKRRGIRIHRCPSLLPASVTLHRGIPVTTPARTIADLRRAASGAGRGGAGSRRRGQCVISPRELRRAIRQAEVLGLPTEAETTNERSRSDLELAFLRLCRRHGLPVPEVNVWIDSMEVDFLWRARRLVVETDGYQFHRGRTAFEDDRERDLRLRSLGFEVVRLTYRQVVEEPKRVTEVLETLLPADRASGRGQSAERGSARSATCRTK